MINILVDGQFFTIKCNKRNIDWYVEKGYDAKLGETINVKATDLIKGSHQKVLVECDYCHQIIKVEWRDYCKYKDKKYSCVHCRQTKIQAQRFP